MIMLILVTYGTRNSYSNEDFGYKINGTEMKCDTSTYLIKDNVCCSSGCGLAACNVCCHMGRAAHCKCIGETTKCECSW